MMKEGSRVNPKVLVTGSSGRIGRNAVSALADDFCVIGFDCTRPVPDVAQPSRFIAGRLPEDHSALIESVSGVECVVHLAGIPDDEFSPSEMKHQAIDRESPIAQLVGVNVLGTCQVLMAAVQAGVRRVVLASTGQVVDGWVTNSTSRVDADSPLSPRYLYASTKVFVEAAGRAFAKMHGLEVLVLRLGWCPRPGQETSLESDPRAPFVYLSETDIGRFLLAALKTDRWPSLRNDPNTPNGGRIPYSVAYVTSQPPPGQEVYDLSVARSLGFEPDPSANWEAWKAMRGKVRR